MPEPVPLSPWCFRLLSQSSSEMTCQKALTEVRGYIKDRYEGVRLVIFNGFLQESQTPN